MDPPLECPPERFAAGLAVMARFIRCGLKSALPVRHGPCCDGAVHSRRTEVRAPGGRCRQPLSLARALGRKMPSLRISLPSKRISPPP